jgi:hypothetical protein
LGFSVRIVSAFLQRYRTDAGRNEFGPSQLHLSQDFRGFPFGAAEVIGDECVLFLRVSESGMVGRAFSVFHRELRFLSGTRDLRKNSLPTEEPKRRNSVGKARADDPGPVIAVVLPPRKSRIGAVATELRGGFDEGQAGAEQSLAVSQNSFIHGSRAEN